MFGRFELRFKHKLCWKLFIKKWLESRKFQRLFVESPIYRKLCTQMLAEIFDDSVNFYRNPIIWKYAHAFAYHSYLV